MNIEAGIDLAAAVKRCPNFQKGPEGCCGAAYLPRFLQVSQNCIPIELLNGSTIRLECYQTTALKFDRELGIWIGVHTRSPGVNMLKTAPFGITPGSLLRLSQIDSRVTFGEVFPTCPLRFMSEGEN